MIVLIMILSVVPDLVTYGRGLSPVKRSVDDETKKAPNLDPSLLQEKMIQEKEELELKMKMETEIEGYHEIKKKIQFLEDHLRQHADFNLIKTEDLVAAAKTLQDLKRTIINPLETNLLAVKNQIKKGDHNLSKDDLIFVKSVLDNADGFLKNSRERIDQLELIENEWDVAEESEKIRLATEVRVKEHKARQKDLTGSAKDESPILLRSKKLQKIKDMVFRKEQKAKRIESQPMKSSDIDFRQVKQRLDYEKLEDEAPGFGKKKIQEALREAADKSHEFIDKKMHHGEHNGDHYSITPMSENSEPPSWTLVFLLASICGVLIVILMLMLFSRPRNSPPWKRNLFKTNGGEIHVGAYCELNDVKHDKEDRESALTTDNLSVDPWIDNSWGDWDTHNSQKKK